MLLIQQCGYEEAELPIGSLSSDKEYNDFIGAPEESDYPPDAPVWGQLTEENCSSNGGYWYGDVCNAEPEIIVEPEPEPEPEPMPEEPEPTS